MTKGGAVSERLQRSEGASRIPPDAEFWDSTTTDRRYALLRSRPATREWLNRGGDVTFRWADTPRWMQDEIWWIYFAEVQPCDYPRRW